MSKTPASIVKDYQLLIATRQSMKEIKESIKVNKKLSKELNNVQTN